MAQVPLRKNPGPPLVSKTIGDVELIPREYRAKIGTKRTVQKQPVDVELSEIGDLLVESSVVQDLTDERKKTNIELIGEIETPLIDETFITGSGQIGHHTRQLVLEGTELAVDALTESADQHNLGNGFLDQNVVTVDEVFPNTVSKMERRHVTPPEFDALIPIQYFENVDDAPFELVTNLFAGDIDRSNEEVTEFHTKHTNTFRDLIDLPVQIVDSETNRYKQVKYVVKVLDSQETLPPNPTSTQDVSWTHLGDETAVTRIEGTEDLFDQHTYERERSDVTPEWAKALLTTFEESFLEEGIAADPDPLDAGVLLERQQQEDVFNRRITSRSRDLLDLPITIHNSRTNRYKQVEDVALTLELDSTSPATPTALRDVNFTVLGDGTAIEERIEIAEVFDQLSASTEIADLVPEIFRAAIPITTEEFVEAGNTIDDPPTLGIGELFRSESRETEETRRIRTRGRLGIEYPQSVIISRQVGAEPFGGELTETSGLLDDSEPIVESGEDVLDSKVINLGNGTWFRQTEKRDPATEWPELIGTEVDPRTGIVIGLKKKVVDAGTEGGVDGDGYHDVKPLDKWRSIKISSKLDPDTLPAPRTWETTVEHRFPNTLVGIAWVWDEATAPFAYDFDMALVLDMLEGYAGPCRAKVTESFTNGPPEDTIVPTIFCPQAHMVGFAWGYAADPSEDCGTCIGIARAHAQTWAIPPSLHDELSIGGAVTLTNGSFTSTLPATTPVGLPSPGSLITKACDVEPWRFNVFYRRLVEIYIPDCGT